MAYHAWLCMTCIGLSVASDAPLLTAWQTKFLFEQQTAAVRASVKAEGQLLEAFDTNAFRMELAAQGLGGVKLALKSSTELLDDLKDALSSMEFLFSFGYDAVSAKLHDGQPQWDLDGIDEHGHIPTLWELKLDGKAGNMPESQWALSDIVETGLYRQREFAKPADPNRTEAEQRPSYVSGNLAHFDAGIWEFGVYAPVYRQSVLKERAIVMGIDSGGWEDVCNSSGSGFKWNLIRHVVPCNAVFAGGNKEVIYGTIDHLLHNFLGNTQSFTVMGGTLARRTYQLLAAPGGASLHPLENNMYLEAAMLGPARMIDMKLFVASFPDLFGTPDADKVREFCKRHKLPLAWAMGGGKMRKNLELKTHKLLWIPFEPFLEWPVNGDRLLDVTSWSAVEHGKVPAGAADLWASVEAEASVERSGSAGGQELDASAFTSWWTSLKPAGGVVHGLSGKSCLKQLDLCFGTSGDTETAGQCLCRSLPGPAVEADANAAFGLIV